MKKKVFFAVATGLFALATVFNMNVLQSNNAGDVSLESIAVMAQATPENGGGNGCDDCQYYMKSVMCVKLGIDFKGNEYTICISSKDNCKTPGTGSCKSTKCDC